MFNGLITVGAVDTLVGVRSVVPGGFSETKYGSLMYSV